MVVFTAPWSRPCQIIRSVLGEVATACAGKVSVVRVNVDDHPNFGIWYDIQSIPTLLGFVHGAVGVRMVGTASKEAILSRLQPFLGGGESSSSTPGVKK